MPRLVITNGSDAGNRLLINKGRYTMGRSVNNDLQIVDRRMSRTHAEVYEEGGAYFVRDLGSKNGTLLNGANVNLAVILNPGDIIQVGDTTVLFDHETESSHGAISSAPGLASSKKDSSVRLVEENNWGATQEEMQAGVPQTAGVEIGKANISAKVAAQRLEILYKVTEAIRSFFVLGELLEQIMEIIMDVLKPDRSYLLLQDEETGELIPEVVKSTDEPIAQMEVKISMSIVERCMNEGISLLVSDAAADDRFAASESIIMNRIRTAMVAPIIYKGDVLGAVYIDTNTRMLPFTKEELELLTGITNQAAVAITNARMHEQLVEQHKIAREMEIARTIQMNLLPKTYPEIEGFEISAMSLPAKHVGGDYYDFLRLPDGRMALAVADVSGKGVPAAILTATTRSYLQSETQHPRSSLAETVSRINGMVMRDVTNDMYVTMTLVYLESEVSKLEYVNAGHCHPILMSPDGTTRYLDKGGLFLGIMAEEAEYEVGSYELAPGDVLLLSTDGVTDIQNEEGEIFGDERLHELLRESLDLTAEGIRNKIYQTCLEHRGEADQFDDFTLIVLKRQTEKAQKVPSSATFHDLDELDFD